MCDLIEADDKMPQCREAGNLLYFTQAVAMKVQHLNIWYHHYPVVSTGTDPELMLQSSRRATYSDLAEEVSSRHI